MTEELKGPYLCSTLGISPLELPQLDLATVEFHLAYHRGKSIGEHASRERLENQMKRQW